MASTFVTHHSNKHNMKKIFSIALLAATSLFAQAQSTTWKIDKSHSAIGFTIDHMVVSETHGSFKDFSADIKSDKADFSDVQLKLTIPLSTINTDDAKRDEHLKSPDFFDVAKNPNMVFVTKSFKKVKGNIYKLTGDLTLNGITKTITLDARFNGIVKSPWGDTRSGVKVYGEIDRYAFGLKYNSLLEAGGMTIGQKVRIACSLELIKG
jgi:polyisoprenoid-binding protein YceI